MFNVHIFRAGCCSAQKNGCGEGVRGGGGGPPALDGTREYEQSNRNP